MEARGRQGEDKWLPHCLGHEGTGTVLEAGAAVTKVKAGDKVVLSWIKGTGIEAGGAVYEWERQEGQRGRRHDLPAPRGGQREPADACFPQVCRWTLRSCSAAPRRPAWARCLTCSKVQPGDSVAVFGTGGIGLNACMAAAFAGAMPVIGDRSQSGPARAGADATAQRHVIDPSGTDVARRDQEDRSAGRRRRGRGDRRSGGDGAGAQCDAPAGRPRRRDRQCQPRRDARARSRRVQSGQEPARHLGR